MKTLFPASKASGSRRRSDGHASQESVGDAGTSSPDRDARPTAQRVPVRWSEVDAGASWEIHIQPGGCHES